MFWLIPIGLALLVVAGITIKVILDKVKEYLRKKKKEIEQLAIKTIEVKVKDIIEKKGKKIVKIGLIGKRKTFLIFTRKKNLGELEIQGDKLEDNIEKGQILKTLSPEEL